MGRGGEKITERERVENCLDLLLLCLSCVERDSTQFNSIYVYREDRWDSLVNLEFCTIFCSDRNMPRVPECDICYEGFLCEADVLNFCSIASCDVQ